MSRGSDGDEPRGEVEAAAPSLDLTWHQTPSGHVPWHRSFGAQVLAVVGLLGASATVGLPHAFRRIRAPRNRALRDAAGAAGLAAFAVMVTGVLVLFETLSLSDAHAGPLFGTTIVSGVSLAYLTAAAASVISVVMGIRLGSVVLRNRRPGAGALDQPAAVAHQLTVGQLVHLAPGLDPAR